MGSSLRIEVLSLLFLSWLRHSSWELSFGSMRFLLFEKETRDLSLLMEERRFSSSVMLGFFLCPFFFC